MSETGLVYTFTTPKLQPLVTKAEGKNLIQVRISHAETIKYKMKTSTDLFSLGLPERP